MDFKDMVVIVTGTSSGIGEGCARKLLELGAKVAGFDIRPARIAHDHFKPYTVDVADDKTVQAAVEDVESALGRIDALVTCAGVTSNRKPFYEMTAGEWDRVVGINLRGTFLCSKYAAGKMIKRREGRIVTIGCIRSTVFGPNAAEYSASKGGVMALTSAMAMDLAPFNIRVNSVAPGVTATAITEKALGDPEVRRGYEKSIPLGRTAMPGDIADVVVFLLSDSAGYMTGETVFVDGGYSKSK